MNKTKNAIVVFPEQGYQIAEVLKKTDIRNFCIRYGLLEEQLDMAVKYGDKFFEQDYAQQLVVAIQLAEWERLKANGKYHEVRFAGIGLGEISALAASGVIDYCEALEFALQRGRIIKNFTEKDLQEGIAEDFPTRRFAMAKIPRYCGLEEDLKRFNEGRKWYSQINITNYIPSEKGMEVTIVGEKNILINNLARFGGSPSNQDITNITLPFHTIALEPLKEGHLRIFESCISKFNAKALERVFSTRIGELYETTYTKQMLSKSLADYLVEPIQTDMMICYIYAVCPDDEIIVLMSEEFTEDLKVQYHAVGGDMEKVRYINDIV